MNRVPDKDIQSVEGPHGHKGSNSRARPSAAWLRLLASLIFTVVPAVALPLHFAHLHAVRPHVTDVRAGFVSPHYSNGVAWYFSHADETLIRALSFWLMAGVILLIFVGGQMMRRPLKQMLRPPPEVVKADGDEPVKPM